VFLTERWAASLIRDPLRDRLIIFGGMSGFLGDLWEWPLQPGHAPLPLIAAGTPPSPRHGASAVYDPVRDRMILHGGSTGFGIVAGDTWELTLSGTPTWSQLSPGGGVPLSRTDHSAIYDPASDAMIMFGGAGSDGMLADTWRLSLGSPMTWTDISPTGPGDKPTIRYGHVAVLDPVEDRMYVYAGNASDTRTWRLELSGTPTWVVETIIGPPVDIGATATYDATRHRAVLFGGRTGSSSSNEVWELAFSSMGATWNELSPSGSIPSGRLHAASAYDPIRDRMLVFGGYIYNTATSFNDLLSLQWAEAVDVDPMQDPSRLSLAPPWPNPSNAGVAIPFAMSSEGHARVRLYDVQGRLVRELLNGVMPAGPRELRWNRRTAAGALARAGVYFVELLAAGERRTQRIVATD
jgi:hypothetical protein